MIRFQLIDEDNPLLLTLKSKHVCRLLLPQVDSRIFLSIWFKIVSRGSNRQWMHNIGRRHVSGSRVVGAPRYRDEKKWHLHIYCCVTSRRMPLFLCSRSCACFRKLPTDRGLRHTTGICSGSTLRVTIHERYTLYVPNVGIYF